MVQPALKVDGLLEEVVALWEQRLTLPENYMPLIRLKKEAEKLLGPNIQGRGVAHMVLAFVHALLWEREETYEYLRKTQNLMSEHVVGLSNQSVIYEYFCDFFRGEKLAESAVALAPNDHEIIGDLMRLCFLTGKWRKVGIYHDEFDMIKAEIKPFDENCFYFVDYEDVLTILEENHINDEEIVFLQKLATEVLIEADVRLLRFTIEAIEETILVTYLFDRRHCESGAELSLRFIEKMRKNRELSKNYGRIVISFVACGVEEIQGEHTAC